MQIFDASTKKLRTINKITIMLNYIKIQTHLKSMWPSPFLSYIRKMCDSNFAMSDSGKQACIISLKFRFVILPSGCFSKKFSYWSSIWPLEIEVFLTMYSKSSSDSSRFLLLTERKFPLKSRIFVQNAKPIFFSDILEKICSLFIELSRLSSNSRVLQREIQTDQ